MAGIPPNNTDSYVNYPRPAESYGRLEKFPAVWTWFLICLGVNLGLGLMLSALTVINVRPPTGASASYAAGHVSAGISFASIVVNALTIIPTFLAIRGIGQVFQWKPMTAWLLGLLVALTSCLCLPPVIYAGIIWNVIRELEAFRIPAGDLLSPARLRMQIAQMRT